MDELTMMKKLEDLQQQADEMMAKYGWYYHLVPGNIHTHGIEESFAHKDLQIALFIPQPVAQAVFDSMVDRIKEGWTFLPGKDYDGVIRSFKIRIMAATENDRNVLRVILPDPDGELDKDKMAKEYATQYEGLD